MQGAELQVLRGMEALLRRPALHTAVVEVSGTELYSGQALQAEVVAFMRGHGFTASKAASANSTATRSSHAHSCSRRRGCPRGA